MSVGKKIKKIRENKGLTQSELANKCGILYQTIGKYERDVLNPKIETIKKIAKALGVDYIELLDTVPHELLTIKKLEKALDKACEELEKWDIKNFDNIQVTKEDWKEWCLKDE